MYMKIRHLFLFFFLFFFILSSAQNNTNLPRIADERLEFIINHVNEVMPSLPSYVQSKKEIENKFGALRFAHPFLVEYSTENSGVWIDNNDGTRSWHVAITSLDAYSLNLIFDRFYLCKGANLFIFNSDKSAVLGAYSDADNMKNSAFATSPLSGETVIIELNEPNGDKTSDILLAAVNHDYLNINKILKQGDNQFKYSDSCHQDVSCDSDSIISLIEKSVCRLIIDGTTLCSGTLINNSLNNGKPYVLTAAHCFDGAADNPATHFTFNYQVPKCEKSIEGNFKQALSGSITRSFIYDFDIALLELDDIPPNVFMPIWAGWDKSEVIDEAVYSIHHPEGDVKKIAKSITAPTNTTFMASRFEEDAHWNIAHWSSGYTEGGSSGAGLFTEDGRLIGVLSGGNSTSCDNAYNDNYARINKAWSFYSEPSKQLAYWLDPNGKNNIKEETYYHYEDTLKRYSNVILTESITAHKLDNIVGNGYWAGVNSLNYHSFAESFGPYHSGKLYGFWIMPAVNYNLSGDLKITLWSGWEAPSVKIVTLPPISVYDLKAKREYFVKLNSPIELFNKIWVEFNLSNIVGENFSFYSSPLYETLDRTNTFWLKTTAGDWIEGDVLLEKSSSLWVDLLISNDVLTDTLVDYKYLFSKQAIYPNPLSNDKNELNILIEKLDGKSSLIIYDLTGRKLKEYRVIFTSGIAEGIQLDYLEQGLYFIVIKKDILEYNFKLQVL